MVIWKTWPSLKWTINWLLAQSWHLQTYFEPISMIPTQYRIKKEKYDQIKHMWFPSFPYPRNLWNLISIWFPSAFFEENTSKISKPIPSKSSKPKDWEDPLGVTFKLPGLNLPEFPSQAAASRSWSPGRAFSCSFLARNFCVWKKYMHVEDACYLAGLEKILECSKSDVGGCWWKTPTSRVRSWKKVL